MIYIKKNILIIPLIFILIFFILSLEFNVKAQVNWNSLKNESLSLLDHNDKDLKVNFDLAISQANLGEIKESYISFDEINDKFQLEEINNFIKVYENNLNQKNDQLKTDQIIIYKNYIAFGNVIKDNYKKAVKYFDKILEKQPENIWIRNYQAAGYIELEELKKAESLLEDTLNIKENEFSNLLLGYIYYEQGNLFKALSQLNKSSDLFDLILKLFR